LDTHSYMFRCRTISNYWPCSLHWDVCSNKAMHKFSAKGDMTMSAEPSHTHTAASNLSVYLLIIQPPIQAQCSNEDSVL